MNSDRKKSHDIVVPLPSRPGSTPRMLRIREDEIKWQFSRSSGPGGQNVNKVSSKATLRWNPKQSALPQETMQRLMALGHNWATAEGEILISSQRHRQQLMNMEDCRDKLRALLRAAAYRPKYRKKTNPTKGAKERRLQEKRQRSERKERRKRLED